jgi:hypothetical protein
MQYDCAVPITKCSSAPNRRTRTYIVQPLNAHSTNLPHGLVEAYLLNTRSQAPFLFVIRLGAHTCNSGVYKGLRGVLSITCFSDSTAVLDNSHLKTEHASENSDYDRPHNEDSTCADVGHNSDCNCGEEWWDMSFKVKDICPRGYSNKYEQFFKNMCLYNIHHYKSIGNKFTFLF